MIGDKGEVDVMVSKSDWIDVEFLVALDSGLTDHVCHQHCAPHYLVEPSPGSKRGQKFYVGNGAYILNDGQVHLCWRPTTVRRP